MLDKFFTRWYNKGTIKVAELPQPGFPEFCSSFSPLSYSRKGRSSGSALSAFRSIGILASLSSAAGKKRARKGRGRRLSPLFVEGTAAALPPAAEKNRRRGRPQAGPIPRPRRRRLSSFNCSMKPDGQEPCTSKPVPLLPKPRLRTEAADRESRGGQV